MIHCRNNDDNAVLWQYQQPDEGMEEKTDDQNKYGKNVNFIAPLSSSIIPVVCVILKHIQRRWKDASVRMCVRKWDITRADWATSTSMASSAVINQKCFVFKIRFNVLMLRSNEVVRPKEERDDGGGCNRCLKRMTTMMMSRWWWWIMMERLQSTIVMARAGGCWMTINHNPIPMMVEVQAHLSKKGGSDRASYDFKIVSRREDPRQLRKDLRF